MANEISVSVTTTISQSGQSVSGSKTFTADLSDVNFVGQEVTIGSSSAAAIAIGGLSAPTVVFVANLDSTNYIEVDSVNTLDNFPQKIHPGQAISLLPETGTIYAKADTADCQAWVVAG